MDGIDDDELRRVARAKRCDDILNQSLSRELHRRLREAEAQEKTDTFYSYERSFGSFARSFTLPDGASSEGTHAELKDGVFTLVLPKKAEAKSQKIPIGAPKGGKA